MPPSRKRSHKKARKTLQKRPRISKPKKSPKKIVKINGKPLLKPTVFYFNFYVRKEGKNMDEEPAEANLKRMKLKPFTDMIRKLSNEFFTDSAPYNVEPKGFSLIEPNLIQMKATVQRRYVDGNEKDLRMWVEVWDEKSIYQSDDFLAEGDKYQIHGVNLKK